MQRIPRSCIYFIDRFKLEPLQKQSIQRSQRQNRYLNTRKKVMRQKKHNRKQRKKKKNDDQQSHKQKKQIFQIQKTKQYNSQCMQYQEQKKPKQPVSKRVQYKDQKKRKKSSAIRLQDQLSQQQFSSLVNDISKNYKSQAHFYVINQRYWQKEKEKQNMRQLRELNKKIKIQLMQNNRLDEELNQSKDKVNAYNQNQNSQIDLNKPNANQQLSQSLEKVKIQQGLSLMQRKNKKRQQQDRLLRQLFQDQKYAQDDAFPKEKQIDPQEQIRKGLKQKKRLKQYLLLVKYQIGKRHSKLLIADMQGTFWQLKLSQEYFQDLKKSLNLTSSLRTFTQYFVKSLQLSSRLRQFQRIKEDRIQNLIEIGIQLAIGEGLLMNCQVQVPRYLSLSHALLGKKDRHSKYSDRKQLRKEYDKQLRRFTFNMFKCQEIQIQKQRQKWSAFANVVNQQIGNPTTKPIKQYSSYNSPSSSKPSKPAPNSAGNKNNALPPTSNNNQIIQPQRFRQILNNSLMLSLENNAYGGPTQNIQGYNSYLNNPSINQNTKKTKLISKKYKTDLMNPNRLRRKNHKGVKLFE